MKQSKTDSRLYLNWIQRVIRLWCVIYIHLNVTLLRQIACYTLQVNDVIFWFSFEVFDVPVDLSFLTVDIEPCAVTDMSDGVACVARVQATVSWQHGADVHVAEGENRHFNVGSLCVRHTMSLHTFVNVIPSSAYQLSKQIFRIY